jgi:dolichol-phosphate mannosyltransferase
MTTTDESPELSVVIPIYNETENLDELQTRLADVLNELTERWEIVYVDDGSRDGSVEVIRAFRDAEPRVKLLRLSRNFGHQAALNAGLDHAHGDAVIMMDGDLQDPPEVLVDLVKHWRSGAEVVYGIRQHRQGNVAKRAGYRAFYRLYRRLADVKVPLDSGDFCLIDRQVADAIRALPESQRFLRGLRSWVGFEQVGVAYDRPERFAGEAKYGFTALVRLAVDGLLSFSATPLRLSSVFGFFTALAGIGYLLFAFVARVRTGDIPEGWTSTVALILIIGGVQLLMIGIVGEYLARVYSEAKHRPSYIIRDRFE